MKIEIRKDLNLLKIIKNYQLLIDEPNVFRAKQQTIVNVCTNIKMTDFEKMSITEIFDVFEDFYGKYNKILDEDNENTYKVETNLDNITWLQFNQISDLFLEKEWIITYFNIAAILWSGKEDLNKISMKSFNKIMIDIQSIEEEIVKKNQELISM